MDDSAPPPRPPPPASPPPPRPPPPASPPPPSPRSSSSTVPRARYGDGPAKLLCRMSIASLVDTDMALEHSTTESTSSSVVEWSSPPARDPQTRSPPAALTPLNCMTQEKRHRLSNKRPAPASDEEEEEEDDDDDGHDSSSPESSSSSSASSALRWSQRTAPPPATTATLQPDITSFTKIKTELPIATHSPPPSPSPPPPPSPPLPLHGGHHHRPAASDTMIVYQPTCLDHHNDTHQENRERLSVLCGPRGILRRNRFSALRWADLRSLRPARLNDILRVHSFQYIQHLERACHALPEQSTEISVGPLFQSPVRLNATTTKGDADDKAEVAVHPGISTSESLSNEDWVQTEHAKRCYKVENPPSGGHFDMDSPISKSSYLAARLAAGAVCHAVDQVMHGHTTNAFVVVRPPGHHAGPNGCVDSNGFHRRPEMCTCGFCLLNNVAIGAAYALTTYAEPYYSHGHRYQPSMPSPPHPSLSTLPPAVTRLAIVDFDIHHGNGTEEILRNLVPHQQNYPLPPSWAPLSFPSFKPWRDEHDLENLWFASIHLYDDDHFYPCSGSGPHGESLELASHDHILNLPLEFLGPKYLEDREKLSAKSKRALMAQASRTFRERITTKLLPALRAFAPDLLLLSAGFDGHADDFYYFLTEDDYAWATEQLTAVANECCQGRVVSVLEGGYNVDAAPPPRRVGRRPNGKAAAKRRAVHKSTTNGGGGGGGLGKATAMDTEGGEEEDLSEYGSLARSCAAHVAALQRAAAAATAATAATAAAHTPAVSSSMSSSASQCITNNRMQTSSVLAA